MLEDPAKCLLAHREVDWSAIVWIDQRKIPQLVALVDVGRARRAELQHRLRQRVEDAKPGRLFLERLEIIQERAALVWIEDRARELQDRILVLGIRRDPAGVNFGF